MQPEPNLEALIPTFRRSPSIALRTSTGECTEDPDLQRAGPKESEKESDLGKDVYRSILPGNPGLEQNPWEDGEHEEEEEEEEEEF